MQCQICLGHLTSLLGSGYQLHATQSGQGGSALSGGVGVGLRKTGKSGGRRKGRRRLPFHIHSLVRSMPVAPHYVPAHARCQADNGKQSKTPLQISWCSKRATKHTNKCKVVPLLTAPRSAWVQAPVWRNNQEMRPVWWVKTSTLWHGGS